MARDDILKAAFGHFANWPAEKPQFEALLDDDVQWVETDSNLTPKTYKGKAAVMAHLDDIKAKLASATLFSVSLEPSGWQTRDHMQVQGQHLHCCISDIDFTAGDLISRVIHCKGHLTVGTGPCT